MAEAADQKTQAVGAPSQGATPRRVAMICFPDVQLLDVFGPLEVLAAATDAEREAKVGAGYDLALVGPKVGPIKGSSGLTIMADEDWSSRPEAIDTLIVAGGVGVYAAAQDPALLDYLHWAAPRARRICSVCTGAGILAAAGLLAGRRVTTHWAYADLLAETFPEVEVDPDPIFLRDGPYWTSAGVTAGLDLALALVEEDSSRDLALKVSRRMVFFLKRPGGQSQFSAQLSGQLADRDPLRDLQAEIVERPDGDHSVEAMAARVGMSPRHFARVFRAEVGQPPGRFVECVRVEAARRALEESAHSVDEIAASSGFGTAETMRRAFLRQMNVGPAAYRERFRRAAKAAVA
ncbi:MAG: GlxA family transcriptional regulator [Myxococcota bacterium]